MLMSSVKIFPVALLVGVLALSIEASSQRSGIFTDITPQTPTAEDQLDATCELFDKQGDIYRQGRMTARNKVGHLVKCSLFCEGHAGDNNPYQMKCDVTLQPGQFQLCAG